MTRTNKSGRRGKDGRFKRKPRTRLQQAAGRLGRAGWAARVRKYGLETLRRQAKRDIGPYEFKKKRPTQRRITRETRPVAAIPPQAVPIPEQSRTVSMPLPPQYTEKKPQPEPVAQANPFDDAAYLQSVIEARMRMRHEEAERQAARERQQMWDEKFYSRD